ncbi:MAG: FMN-binding protein [Bacteroidales bacterium]|nr:FMN-binding protein [Bacteroidales bacterium]
MKRNINSNGYIFLYSTILVMVVAALLTTAALLLQPYQQRNKENEKRTMILSAAGVTEGKITFLDEELPLYLVNDTISVIPMEGKGLWGPIWGYIAIAPDGKTVIGAIFDHKSETPGLGGEITKEKFRNQFKGKQISSDGYYVPVEFDAITGATKTSNGVKEMIDNTMKLYYWHEP